MRERGQSRSPNHTHTLTETLNMLQLCYSLFLKKRKGDSSPKRTPPLLNTRLNIYDIIVWYNRSVTIRVWVLLLETCSIFFLFILLFTFLHVPLVCVLWQEVACDPRWLYVRVPPAEQATPTFTHETAVIRVIGAQTQHSLTALSDTSAPLLRCSSFDNWWSKNSSW